MPHHCLQTNKVCNTPRAGLSNLQPIGQMRHALATPTPSLAKGGESPDISRDDAAMTRV